jgi:hypothetical protein
LHLLVDLVTLASEVFLLFDGAVRLSILLSKLIKNSVELLLLLSQKVLGVSFRVQFGFKTIDKRLFEEGILTL